MECSAQNSSPRKNYFLHLPNALTSLRILAIPAVVALLYPEHGRRNDLAAGLLFGAAFCTDFLDGIIARRTKSITRWGRILDPVADKLMVLAAVLLLVRLDRLNVLVAILLLAREMAVSALRSLAGDEGISLPSIGSAKVKTVLEGFALAFLMAGPEFHFWGIPWMRFGTILVYIALGLALWSGGVYFVQYSRGPSPKRPS